MKPGWVYLAGLLLVLVFGWLAALYVHVDTRFPLRVAVVTGVLVQGPIGWWLIRTIGTPRMLGAWITGMVVRIVVIGLFALVVTPALQVPAEAMLFSLVGVLFALLLLEVVVVTLGNQRTEPS